jgi:iron uptake system EfeUOB component EfeO/EfeM
LAAHDAALARTLDGRFAALDHTVSRYRTSAGYRPYPALSPADRTLMGSQLSVLAEALTGLSAVLDR